MCWAPCKALKMQIWMRPCPHTQGDPSQVGETDNKQTNMTTAS